MRVDRPRVGEARAITGADCQTATVEHAADERVHRPFGAEQALGHQNPAFERRRLVFVKARRLVGTRGRELAFARLLCGGRDRDSEEREARRGRSHPAHLRARQRPLRIGDPQRNRQPDQREDDVDCGELRDAQVKNGRADKHRGGRHDVAAPDEEGIDRLFRLVFLFPRCRQPQQLPGRVHDRVVRRVLRRLDPADQTEPGAGGDDRVAAQRDQRQRQQYAGEPAVLDETRGDERLQQERSHVDPELVIAGVRADERLPVEGGIERRQLLDVYGQQSRDQVLAGGVHHVEQDNQHRDQAQVLVAEDQLEAARRGHAGLRCLAAALVAPVDPDVQEQADRQQRCRNLQDALRIHAETKQPRRHEGSKRRPRRHADHDDREQPIAGLFGVDVVRERPELRDERHVEDTDPDEEGDADIRHAGRHRRREQLDARDEEQGDAHQQPGAVDAGREPAVERNESHQQQRLTGRGVRAHFGAAAEQNQRFANRLDD